MAKPILKAALGASLLALATPAFAADPAPPPPAAASADPAPPPASASANPEATAKPEAPAKPDASAKPDAPPPEASPEPAPEIGKEKNPAQDPIVSSRRAGFTVGVMGSFGLGNITGYPNDVAKRGKAEFRTDTGVAYGPNGTFFLGGAITDWLVFGAGLGGTYSLGNNTIVSGYTIVLHTEVFPLFWLGGALRDTGLALDTGVGIVTGELADKPSGAAGKQVAPVIDSGLGSRFSVSAFYDGLRLWKMSAGPYIGFDYTWSATLEQPLVLIGLRGALYVKAPKK